MKDQYEMFSVKDAGLILDFVAVVSSADDKVDPWKYLPTVDDSLSLVRGSDGQTHTLSLASGPHKLSAAFSLAEDRVVCSQNAEMVNYDLPALKQKLQGIAKSVERACDI